MKENGHTITDGRWPNKK